MSVLGIEPPYVAEQIADHVIIWPVRKLAQSVCEMQPCPQHQSITNQPPLQRLLLNSTLPLPYQQSVIASPSMLVIRTVRSNVAAYHSPTIK
jgi:hypothetical protein